MTKATERGLKACDDALRIVDGLKDHFGGEYFVTAPVDGGYSYWDVRQPNGPHGPNFSLVSIWKGTPGAEELALLICRWLNAAKREAR